MAKPKRPKKTELMSDYGMLEAMSGSLGEHRKNVLKINKELARKLKGDFKYGLIENLQEVAGHMKNAQKELDKARKELKRI
jgi:hypothetical protein